MKKFPTIFCFLIFAALHAKEPIHLFLVGPGLVGGEVLHQIQERFSREIRVVGLATSKKMGFDQDGIDLEHWKDSLVEPMSLDGFIQQMVDLALPRSIFVDCTTSQEMVGCYPMILQSKIAVVTPNKKANSGSYLAYCILRNLARENHVAFLYDANVGAGLPIIHTIKSMKEGGDAIVKIEAILSGTLSYLFNTFDGSVPFSQVVRDAQRQGYTEPDPRDDLNGMDMARKFLILAREAGLPLEIGDIIVERFLPDECFKAASVDGFYDKLEAFDETFATIASEARKRGEVLRFIGILENGKASLSLQVVGSDHPFYHLSDTNNIVSITSKNYSKNPVVIKGPGAGATVTAASVLSNIMQAGR